MNIIELKHPEAILKNPKLNNAYIQLVDILNELRKKDLPQTIVEEINARIALLNSASDSESELKKAIKTTQSDIIKLLEKELKIVPKSYYRNMWMALGIAAFGVPLGVVFGMSIGNMGMMAVGIPIGMAVGLGVGMSMDKKAFEEGRQLDIEIKS